MATGTRGIGGAALMGSSSSSEIDQKPKIEIEQPFDRDGVRWHLVTIRVGPEVVGVETLLSDQDKEPVNSLSVGGKEYILVGTLKSIQRTLCLPLIGKKQKAF